MLFPLVVADTFGTRHFPQIFGVLMAAFFPGGALGPIALAAVHEATGSYGPAFGAAFALATTAALAVLLLPRART